MVLNSVGEILAILASHTNYCSVLVLYASGTAALYNPFSLTTISTKQNYSDLSFVPELYPTTLS